MSELVIIAGLCAEDVGIVADKIIKNIKDTTELKFFTVSKKNPEYDVIKLKDFLKGIAKFISRKAPEKLRLIYVPYYTSEVLVNFFFPFADIHSIVNDFYHSYVLNFFEDTTALAIEISNIIKRSIKIPQRPGKKHCVMLPIYNFIIDGEPFKYLLKEYYLDTLDDDVLSCLKKNSKYDGYEDSRGIVFPAAKVYEGRLAYKESEMDPEYYLSGIYRFGYLWDPGFHFDVTHATNATLAGVEFSCRQQGKIEGKNATHANIYLNDFIRIQYVSFPTEWTFQI